MATSNPRSERMRSIEFLAVNVIVGAMFALFAIRALQAWLVSGQFQLLLLAIQEGVIVWLLITRRRSQEESRSWWDRSIAIIGTMFPLLLGPSSLINPTLELIGTIIQLVGSALSIVATVSLGRSFGIVAANRGIKTGGLYRYIRHPLYGSYIIGHIGFLLGGFNIFNAILIFATWTCHYLRALAEERVLARDPEYAAYMQKVKKRFIPFIF